MSATNLYPAGVKHPHSASVLLVTLAFFAFSPRPTSAQISKSGAAGDQTQTSFDQKAVVAGAGNEHVPFQVIINTPIPPGHRPKAPEGFFIETSNLTSTQGRVIDKKQIKSYVEHYIMLYAKSSPVGATL